jgi:hypothetical protein
MSSSPIHHQHCEGGAERRLSKAPIFHLLVPEPGKG